MTRDQFIREMMGKPDIIEAIDGSSNRKYRVSYNYSKNPADILELQQLVMGAEWWDDFYNWASWKCYEERNTTTLNGHIVRWLLIDPNRFADLVAEFKGWKP